MLLIFRSNFGLLYAMIHGELKNRFSRFLELNTNKIVQHLHKNYALAM